MVYNKTRRFDVAQEKATFAYMEAELFRISENFKLLRPKGFGQRKRTVPADEVYRRIVLAQKNTIIFKMLTDYLDWFVESKPRSTRVRRQFAILLKYLGVGITAEDIQTINARGRVLNYDPFENGFLKKDLALLYGYSTPVIEPSWYEALYDLWRVTECYLNNDKAALLAKMPENLRRVHEFQRAHKIADLATAELLRAGQCLQRFNFKDIEIAPVAYPTVFEQNLGKNKAVFPKIEILQSMLGDKALYERVVMADCWPQKLKLLADYVDYMGAADKMSQADRETLCRVANAYISGTYQSMLQQMPDNFRKVHACRQIESMSMDDLNNAFRWLYAGIKQNHL